MKYIDADKLITKLENYANNIPASETSIANIVGDIFNIIDSFQQEQPPLSSDLNEAAEKSSAQYYVDAGYSPFPNVETAAHKSGFIAGAEWHEQQMLKDAVEGEIQMRYSGCLCAKTIRAINEDKFKLGDKVRIIVVKEDEK